jgi:hypothetical protein
MLSAFLDRYRETMIWKLAGLSRGQAPARALGYDVSWAWSSTPFTCNG